MEKLWYIINLWLNEISYKSCHFSNYLKVISAFLIMPWVQLLTSQWVIQNTTERKFLYCVVEFWLFYLLVNPWHYLSFLVYPSDELIVLHLWAFNLHSPKEWLCQALFSVLISHSSIRFSEMSTELFCSLLIGIFDFIVSD